MNRLSRSFHHLQGLRKFHSVTGNEALRVRYEKLGLSYDELTAASKRQFQSSNLDDWLPKLIPKTKEEIQVLERKMQNKHKTSLEELVKDKPYLANPLIVRAIEEIERDMEKTSSQIFTRLVFWVAVYFLLLLPPLVGMFTDPESSISCNRIVEIPMLESRNPLEELLNPNRHSSDRLNFLKRREATEELERVNIRFSGTKPRTTEQELEETRFTLEKELFISVLESSESLEVINDYWIPIAENFVASTFAFYFFSALSYSAPFLAALKMATRRILYIGKRSSLCLWVFAFTHLMNNVALLLLYFQSYIMDSKYRALLLLEKDDFNKQLMHSYGARGVAFVRLLEESDDDSEELIQMAKDIVFHNHPDDEDPSLLTGTISINDSIVVQLFDDPIREDCFFADEEGFEKFKANIDKIKKSSREMLNDEYLENKILQKKVKITGTQNNYVNDVVGTLSWANIKRTLALSEMWERSHQESLINATGWQDFKDRFITYSMKSWYFLANANDFAKRETGDCLCSNIRFFV